MTNLFKRKTLDAFDKSSLCAQSKQPAFPCWGLRREQGFCLVMESYVARAPLGKARLCATSSSFCAKSFLMQSAGVIVHLESQVELSVVNLARLPACRKGARRTTTTARSISPSANSCASSIRHHISRKHVGQIRFQQGPEGGPLPVLPDGRAQRCHKVNDPSPTDGVSRQHRSVNDSSYTRFP